MRSKIALNLIKICVLGLSLKWVPKSIFQTKFWESWEKCIFSTLVWPTFNEGQNNCKSHKNRSPCLSLKWVSKSTLKFQFRESQQKCIFLNLVWPTLNEGQHSSKFHKNRYMHAYLSNGYLIPLSNFNSEKVKKVHLFNLGLTNLEGCQK